jgi:D-3-phosphoglycerate dehydrogenase
LLYIDEPVPADAVKALEASGNFQQVKPLTFVAI